MYGSRFNIARLILAPVFALMLSAPAAADSASAPALNTPAAPAKAAATPADKQVTISWAPVTGAASYNVYYSTKKGVTPATGARIAGARNPCVHTGLANGTAYYYVVTAVNPEGESAASAQVTATPKAARTIPAAPSNVAANPGDAANPADAANTIKWDPVPGATSYNVYYSTTINVTRLPKTRLARVTAPYVHTGLIYNTTYYYVVTALNAIGESMNSAKVFATPRKWTKPSTRLEASQFAKLAEGDTWTWSVMRTMTLDNGTTTRQHSTVKCTLGAKTLRGMTNTTETTTSAGTIPLDTYEQLDSTGRFVSTASTGNEVTILPPSVALKASWETQAGPVSTTVYTVTGINETHRVPGLGTFDDVLVLAFTTTTNTSGMTSTTEGTTYISMSVGRDIETDASGTFSGPVSGSFTISRLLQPGYIAK